MCYCAMKAWNTTRALVVYIFYNKIQAVFDLFIFLDVRYLFRDVFFLLHCLDKKFL